MGLCVCWTGRKLNLVTLVLCVLVYFHTMIVWWFFLHIQGTIMQANISSNRLPRYQEQLIAGTMFSISGFDVARCAQNFRLTDSSLLIRFSETTSFKELSDPVSPLPTEGFRFRNQSELHGLANTNSHLPGKVFFFTLLVHVVWMCTLI